MGKMQNALIMTAIIQLALAIFYQSTPASSLLSWILNPSTFTSGTFFSIFNSNLFLAAGAIGIIAGLYFVRSDFVVYVTLGAILITFAATLYEFWGLLNTSFSFVGNASGIISSAFVLPLLIYYIMSTSDFVRGRD